MDQQREKCGKERKNGNTGVKFKLNVSGVAEERADCRNDATATV